jgi:hypothetical protein
MAMGIESSIDVSRKKKASSRVFRYVASKRVNGSAKNSEGFDKATSRFTRSDSKRGVSSESRTKISQPPPPQ